MSTPVVRYPSPDLVPMGDRLVRRVWEVDRVDPGGELPSIHATIEVRNGVPELREFSLRSTETGAQIERVVLRNFDFEGMIEYAAADERAKAGMWGMEGTSASNSSVVTVDDLIEDRKQGARSARTARRTRITPALLKQVADVYRAADSAPVRAVAEHFGKQRRMATLYVQRARQDGYLGEDD